MGLKLRHPVGRYVDGVLVDRSFYARWVGMKGRCTSGSRSQRLFPNYVGCTYNPEWVSFDNYMDWATKQVGFDCFDDKGKAYHLDKDLLFKGNKHYSPETCVFVPAALNTFLGSNAAKRGEYPIGVYFNQEKQKYKAEIRLHFDRKTRHLGYFQSIPEAFLAYKSAKEVLAKELALHYADKVDKRVIQVLNNFTVEIGD